MNEEELWSEIDELERQLASCIQEKEKAQLLVKIMQTRVVAYGRKVSGTYFTDSHVQAIIAEHHETISEHLEKLNIRVSATPLDKNSLKELLIRLKELACSDRSRLICSSSNRIDQIEATSILSFTEHDCKRLLHTLGLENQPLAPKRQPLWNEDRLWLEQQEWHSPQLEEYHSLWKGFLEEVRKAARKHLWQIPNQCFISYAWPTEENSQIEKWMKQFLGYLREDLKLAGIEAKLDRLDNTTGRSIYNYMDEVTDSSCVIVVGSASLLKKHQSATSAVCNELILINRKRRQGDTIFPLLLSGSLEEAFPPYFELYTTVRNWQTASYASDLQSLLREIFNVGTDNKLYQQLWQKFASHPSVKALANTGLSEEEVTKRKEFLEELKLKEKELDQKESQKRLEKMRQGHAVSLAEREQALLYLGSNSSSLLASSSGDAKSLSLPTGSPRRDPLTLENTLSLCSQPVLQQKEIENELELSEDANIARTIPIEEHIDLSSSNFKALKKTSLFVDKTRFIEKVINNDKAVMLITRPRRFFKTSNMSMLRYFFANEIDGEKTFGLFDNLEIGKKQDILRVYQGQYKTIFLSFYDFTCSDYDTAIEYFKERVAELYAEKKENNEVIWNKLNEKEKSDYSAIIKKEADEQVVTKSLKKLMQIISKSSDNKIVILIDEYDTPYHHAFNSKPQYHEKLVNFLRSFIALKDNPYYFRGVVTGILRVAKSHILSGLNNLGVYTVTNDDTFSDCFGLTESEVKCLLALKGLNQNLYFPKITNYYGGYNVGNAVVFNPLSSLSYISDLTKEKLAKENFQSYWMDTAENEFLIERIQRYLSVLNCEGKLRQLITSSEEAKPIITRVSDNIIFPEEVNMSFGVQKAEEHFWSYLLFLGYLTTRFRAEEDNPAEKELVVSNRELFIFYARDVFRLSEEQEFINFNSLDREIVISGFVKKLLQPTSLIDYESACGAIKRKGLLALSEIIECFIKNTYHHNPEICVLSKKQIDELVLLGYHDTISQLTKNLKSKSAILEEGTLDSTLSLLRRQVLQQREVENELELYMPLSGALSSGQEAELFDVETTVTSFLNSNKKVLLLLGEAGAGKTIFGRYLERKLWEIYEPSSSQVIPLFIPLTSLQDPIYNLMDDVLYRQGFTETQCLKLKTQRSLILILDGYDELNKADNLYGSNQLYDWNVKVIITCRSPYLMGVYSYRFAPIDALGRIDYSVYQEFHLKPFTFSQIECYLQKYVSIRKPDWTDWQQYQQAIKEIPHLKELIETPYILYIVVEALPSIVKKYQAHTPSLDRIRLTRADIYEAFIQRWFQKQEDKLRPQGRLAALHVNMQKAFMNYAKGLASEMWKAGVNAITWQPKESCPFKLEGDEGQAETRDSRWDKFFDDSANPQLNVVRSGCPLRKQGENQWLFVHKSLQEYLGARQIFDEAGVIPTELNQKLLKDEPSMIRFLVDRATTEEGFKESLWGLIERSKLDESVTVAAANAITILNYAGMELNQKDLRGIRIAGADLTGANLDHADLTEADLREVNLHNAFLRGADLNGAKMAGVSFGLWPSLNYGGKIDCLCYSPDDKWLATGVRDKIYLWDLEASQLKHTLRGHKAEVTSLSFRDDSQQLASGSDDMSVKLWEVVSGRLERSLKGHTWSVTSVSYRGDGQQLASGSGDWTVKLWEVASGRLERSLEGHTDWVTSVSYRGDGQQLASGSSDTTVKLWEVSSGRLENSLEGHTDWVSSVSYRGDGQQLASGSKDKTVKLWEVSSGRLERSLEGHTDWVSSVSYRGDGQQLVSGSLDQTVKLWRISSGRLERSLEGHTNWVTCVSYRGDGQQLASGSGDGAVKLWMISSSRLERRLEGHTDSVTSVSYREDGQQLASGSLDQTVKLWRISSGRLEMSLERHTDSVTCVNYRGDGQQLASGSGDWTVKLWEVASGQLERILKGHTSGVTSVSYRGDSQQLASGSGDGAVKLWEVSSGRLERSLEGHTDAVTSVSYRGDGQQLASGSWDKTVKLWEVSSGRLERSLEGHTGYATCVSYRGDGQQLASGSGDGAVKLWEVSSGRLERSLEEHTDEVNCVSYQRDGQQLASGSNDKTIRIWSSFTGQCLHVIWGHLGSVQSVCFSPDNTLASGGSDNTVKVWREQDVRGQKVMVLHWSRGPHSFFAKGCQIRGIQGLAPREREVLEEFEAKAIENGTNAQAQTESASSQSLPEVVPSKKKAGCRLL